MLIRAFTLCAVAGFLAACLAEEADQTEPDDVILMDTPEVTDGPRGIYIEVPPELEDPYPPDKHAGTPTVVYLNKDGGTYTPGYNDSSNNVSSIVNSTSFVPAWSVSTSNWNSLVDCVADLFEPFNIVVTDQNPGSALHIEAVIAGNPQDIGMQSGVGGVSPFSCGVIDDSIVFAFAEVYNSVQSLCETAGQEIAHSFGLDHEYLCSDPMTYLNGCGAKTFQDVDAQCGEYSARSCQCGGSTQNSVQMMYSVIGAADEQLAPEVNITQPSNGATVAPGFAVQATATDDDSIDRVELYVDGNLVSTDQSAPFSFTTNANLSAGNHSVEARAFDSAQLSSSDTISVSIDDTMDPPDPPDDPNDPPDDPDDPPQPPDFPDGETGAFCMDGSDCISGMCASDGSEDRCTESCDTDDPASCPDGFDCLGAGNGQNVCWPQAGGGNGADDGPDPVVGGCSTGGDGGLSLALLAIVGLLTARRRRTA